MHLIVVAPRPVNNPPRTATVTRTQAGTLKGSGRTQKAPGSKEVGETSALSEEALLMSLQDKGELVATVSVPTDVSAAELVTRVTRQTRAGEMSAGEASDLLYPFLFDGTVHDRRQVFATLQKVATPEAILETAFRTYRLQGYEGYLNEAASLLAGFGAAAWPAMRKWAQLGGAECESLVETAFSVQGVPDGERLAGLKDLIGKGDHNTRSRALGALHMLPRPVQRELLTLMARTGESDDPTRDEAEERLAEEFA
jgi:hypothetical protein